MRGNKFGPNLNCSFMNWFVNLNQLPTRLYSGQLQPDQLTILDSESIIDKKKNKIKNTRIILP